MAKVKHDQGLRDGENLCTEKSSKQRLLVVANRLPVSAVRKGENAWTLDMSSGGLVSALLGVKEFEAKWIGWAGVNVPDEVEQRTLTKVMGEKKCIPVFLDEEIVDQYYNGYCNNILWPLFHYLGFPQEDQATTRSFQSQFDAYKKANQMFADVVNQHYQKGDIVWCHDYHLMLLPKYLKEHNSTMKVGWFLHTPFPSSEIYRNLPSQSELLRAVLAADLVGFHTNNYARNFVSACTGILGLKGTPDGVEYQGKLTRVAAFPIGIDSDRFIQALELPKVQDHIKELKKRFAGRKVILGVDRLDPIKGIPQKLLAFEKLLEENPDCCDSVVLLQIAIPTRTDVLEYQKLTCQVHEIVGRVNGKFGSLTAVPIHHLDRSIDFHALCALYAVTDVVMITSLRDGMNLVSYEFVACQASKKGVLILSEFAGAAQFLGAGAILVNPWNVSEVAASIGNALKMPADEREKRHHHNFKHVTTHTSQKWADTFVSKLNDIDVEADQLRIKHILPVLPVNIVKKRYATSNNRLLILGFNDTLTDPLHAPKIRGDHLTEMELKLHPELKDALRKLCYDKNTTIVVISGSDRRSLDKNFGEYNMRLTEYNMWLAAENGMFLRHTRGEWMTTMPKILNKDWVDSVKHVFEHFTKKTPKSYIEFRETSLVWNYKYADAELGRLQARDMLKKLSTGPISNAAVDVIQGGHSVEVREGGVTKGATMDRILAEIVHNKEMIMRIDYVLCVGDFLPNDEDIYTFFEPELPSDRAVATRQGISNTLGATPINIQGRKFGSKISQNKAHRPFSSLEEKAMTLQEGSSVFDLPGDNYFSCTVGRKSSKAKYLLGSSAEVVLLLKELSGFP